MKKKILSLGIVAILIAMLVTLSGCGEEQNQEQEQEQNVEEEQTQETINIEEIYKNYIKEEKYKNDIKDWEVEPKQYAILDINQDGISELFITGWEDQIVDWSNNVIYTYDKEKNEVIIIDNIYCYSKIRYDSNTKEIVYTDIRPNSNTGFYGFYKLENNKFVCTKTVGSDEGKSFIRTNEQSQTITEEEENKYYENVEQIEFIDISTLIPEQKNTNETSNTVFQAGNFTLEYGKYTGSCGQYDDATEDVINWNETIELKSDGTYTITSTNQKMAPNSSGTYKAVTDSRENGIEFSDGSFLSVIKNNQLDGAGGMGPYYYQGN